MIYEIYNTQTGEKKLSRDNLYKNHYAKKFHNGQPIWKIIRQVDKLQNAFIEPEVKKEEPKPAEITIESLIKELETKTKVKVTFNEFDGSFNICPIANMPEIPTNISNEIAPFEMDFETLKTWLSEQGIKVPFNVKKLETLQMLIPEIFKTQK